MTDLDLGLAENMTDDEIDALARDPHRWLAVKTLLEREAQERKAVEVRRISIETRPGSPGALAVALGQEQLPHLAMIDDLLVRARNGEPVRAAVSMPARHGKSDRTMKVGSLWMLDENPDSRIMQISGSKDLVTTFSRWVRDELERPGTNYRVRPRSDVRAVDDWEIDGHKGGIFVGSMTSRIIGRGSSLLLVDDLLGSPQEAESPVYRERAWQFLQAAFGRLEPNASVIIVNSRWRADDPIGRLLKEQPGRWEYLQIPALAERHGPDPDDLGKCLCGDLWDGGHEDPLGRAPGVPLWPARYDVEALENRRLEMGSFYFSAQMQQRPLRRTGGLWREEWITEKREAAMTVEEMIDRLRLRTVAVDPSASDDDGGDEAGIVVGGKDKQTAEAVITADLSGIYTPEGWARTALVAAVELDGDIVYEKNLTPVFMRRSFKAAWEGMSREADQAEDEGFDPGTVARVLETGRIELPRLMPALHPVRAKVGKELRASPVAQRYEQRKVVHAGVFPLLEEQQLTWRPQVDKDSPDRLDACLVAGSMIQTAQGLRSIEAISVGEQVWTRGGWRSVIWSGQTRLATDLVVVETSLGTVECTPDHRIWTVERGWISADSLVYGDTLVGCPTVPRSQSGSTGSSSSDLRSVSTGHRGSTTRRISTIGGSRESANSTSRSGRRRTARRRFLKAMSFITSISTRSTTSRRIFAASPGANTPLYTETAETSTARNGSRISRRSDPWPRNGIVARKVENGTASTAQDPGTAAPTRRSSATDAGSPTRLATQERAEPALVTASLRSGDANTATTTESVARSAAPSSGRTGTPDPPPLVAVSVERLSVRGVPQTPVYDLTVEGDHEFFANGVLVHNCVHLVTFLGDTGAPAEVTTSSEGGAAVPTGSRGVMGPKGPLSGASIAMGRRGRGYGI